MVSARALLFGVCLVTGCRIGFDLRSDASGDASSSPAAVCTLHWCWESAPPVERRTLRAIDGSGPTDVWAVGDGGVIRHWDGAAWTFVTSPTSDALTAVDVAAPDDVTIAAGAGTLWHYDGSSWVSKQTPSGSSVAAFWRDPANELWAAGENGSMIVNGAALTSQPMRRAATALHGTSRSNVWHAGVFNTVSRWTGSQWTSMLISDFPRAAWALDSGDAFFGGTSIYRCTPTPTCVAEPLPGAYVFGLWGFADDDVWAVGLGGRLHHYNGATWQTTIAPNQVIYYAAWGAAPDDLWAVGYGGAIMHYDGASWTNFGSDTQIGATFDGIYVGEDTDRWIAGRTALWRSDGGPPAVTTAVPEGISLGDEVEGTGPGNVYALDYGNAKVLHYNGTSWRPEPGLDLPMPTGLAASATETIASNIVGQVFEKPAGGAWTMRADTTAEYHGVCISPAGAAMAVGRFGMANVRASAAAPWVVNNTPTQRFLRACTFTGGGDEAWGVGGDAVAHYAGGTWTLDATVPTGESLSDVLAISPTEVYVVGGGGRILAFDGVGWAEEATPAAFFISNLTRSHSGTIFTAGDDATILRRR